jgi:bacteriophage HK97-gp10 putative tail-component
MPVTSNIDQIAAFFDALALEIENGAVKSFDYIGDFAVKEMQRIAPVDTGALKRGIRKVKSGPRSVDVVSNALYSQPVDQGHKTRQGTGHGEHYKPKVGGKSFVPANPFFTSVVKRLQGDNGELIKRAKMDMDKTISATLSKYGVK